MSMGGLPILLATLIMMTTTNLSAGYTSAWVTPFDDFSSEGWDCFEEIDVFAMAFDAGNRVFTAYPRLLEQSAAAKPKGALLMPVIVNDVWDPRKKDAETLKSIPALVYWLDDAKRLDQHVDDLAAAAAPYDGIELDYERVPEALWENYALLIEKLADKLHAQGKRLGVDVEAGPLYSRGGRIARRYWPRLAAAADKIKIMCYYERGEFSRRPGPGSSTAFVEDTGRRALAYLPADKTSLAFSLAATDWELPLTLLRSHRHVARLHFRKARQLQEAAKAKPLWDEAFGAPYFRYEKDGAQHEVWYEDKKSLGRKIEAARRLNLGVSLWYLGAARPDLKALGLCRGTPDIGR